MFGLLERARGNSQSEISTTEPQILLQLYLVLERRFDYIIDWCEFNPSELKQFKIIRDTHRWGYEKIKEYLQQLCEQRVAKFAEFSKAIAVENLPTNMVNRLKTLAIENTAVGFFSCLVLVHCYETGSGVAPSEDDANSYRNRAETIASDIRISAFETLLKMKPEAYYRKISNLTNTSTSVTTFSRFSDSLQEQLKDLQALVVQKDATIAAQAAELAEAKKTIERLKAVPTPNLSDYKGLSFLGNKDDPDSDKNNATPYIGLKVEF